ncbi:hypothetical protein SDC9_75617 [bioreactor metagenome]|uniref:Uncharacterized protein n=1 Tax=bioreactor metagenome TaxID=1076179 RepID=A0A644YM56_9ZZZZ
MGDKYRRDVQFLLDSLDRRAHLNSQLCIKVGKWFVKQEQLGFYDQSPREGNPLALASGELLGKALFIPTNPTEFHHACNFFDGFLG